MDKDLYKLYVFSKDMKLEKEINMAKKGYRPIKLRGNLLIVTSYVKEFNEKYIRPYISLKKCKGVVRNETKNLQRYKARKKLQYRKR